MRRADLAVDVNDGQRARRASPALKRMHDRSSRPAEDGLRQHVRIMLWSDALSAKWLTIWLQVRYPPTWRG